MTKAINGGGTVFRKTIRGKVKWVAQVSLPPALDGKRPRTSRTCATRAEAEKARRQMLAARDQGRLAIQRREKVLDYGLDWIRNVKRYQVRDTTAWDYEARLRREIAPYLGAVHMVDLTAPKVEAWMALLREQGKAASTVNGARAVLNMMCKHATKNGFIPHNPVAATDTVKRQPGDRTQVQPPWSLEELSRVLTESVGSPVDCFIHLMAHTGIRPGEALGLRWSDVDLVDAKCLKVTGTLKEARRILEDGVGVVRHQRNEPKTSASRRELPINDALYDALYRQKFSQLMARDAAPDKWINSDYVLTSAVGTPVFKSNNRARYKKFLAKIGTRYIRPHDIRHTAVTVLLNDADTPIEKVSQAVGHTRIDTTKQIYAKHIPRYNNDAINALSNILPGPIPESQASSTIGHGDEASNAQR